MKLVPGLEPLIFFTPKIINQGKLRFKSQY